MYNDRQACVPSLPQYALAKLHVYSAKSHQVLVGACRTPHVGLSGQLDHEIWKYSLDHDFTVVTTNARDFIKLLNVDVLSFAKTPGRPESHRYVTRALVSD